MLLLQVATHLPTVYTKNRALSVSSLDNSALVTSCYVCRKVTDIENTVME